MSSRMLRRDTYANYLSNLNETVIGNNQRDVRQEVLAADDLDILFDKMDELGIDPQGLDTIEEFRERIFLHLDTLEMTESSYDVVLQSLITLSKDDQKRRKNLRKLLQSCLSTFQKFNVRRISTSGRESMEGSKDIENLLITEGKTKDLSADLMDKIKRIETTECIVVVSGETSAGKSSFLNLFIGQQGLLPEHALPCTSVITRLSYGDVPSVKIVMKDNTVQKVELKPDEGIGEQIQRFLFHREELKRTEGHEIREVQIRGPVPLLKSGLVLVDSPGIGENEAMDAIIHEFVETNNIMGFIYLIKSDQAGGVQEDRIGNLLKLILEKEKSKGEQQGMDFDPESAIFVCNMWDLIKQAERDLVHKNIITRLANFWPGITKSQVLPLSTKRARNEIQINRKYLTSDYKNVLCAVESLFSGALDRRVRSIYGWLESILKRMTQHLKTFVNRLDTSEDDLAEKLEQINLKLQNLQQKSKKILEDLKESTENTADNIYTQFKEYLSSPQARTRIVNWTLSEIPNPEMMKSWTETKASLYKNTSARISKELAHWEEDKGVIKQLRDELQRDVKRELNLLEEEIEDITDDLQSDSTSLSSSAGEGILASQLGATRRRRLTLPSISVDVGSGMPIGFVAQYLHPLGNALGDIVSSSTNRLKEYQKNPRKVAKDKSDRFLKYLLNTPQGNTVLRAYIDNLLEGPKVLITGIQKRIPSIVKTNIELMDQILRSKRNSKESRSLYEDMMEGVESLKQQVMEYGKGEIFVNDFKTNDIKLCDSAGRDGRSYKVTDFFSNSSESTSMKHESRGLWTVMENGILNDEDSIYIKMYLVSAKIENTHSEVSKLRFLQHKHVAEFLGIHHTGGPNPAFIFKDRGPGRMQTLYQFFKASKASEGVVPRILTETVTGLEYLHRRSLVHMELNIYTVTIDGGMTVKLTGGCLPRRAALPQEKEAIQTSFFVYLSPDVLCGETYLACDDIYSLCLLIYELVLERKPFLEQRKWRMDQFIQRMNPYQMLNIPEAVDKLDPPLKTLLIKGLDIRADTRPKVEDFYHVLTSPGVAAAPPGGADSQFRRNWSHSLQYNRS